MPNNLLNLKLNWRLFFFNFVSILVMVILQHLLIHHFSLINPLPQKKLTIIEKITPLLEQKPNSFKLIKPLNLISEVSADNDFNNASSFILLDFDSGQIISDKNPDQKLPIASLTKIMTAVVALDLVKTNEQITISQKAATAPPTAIGIVPNQKMTLEELLNGMLITSANDAAEAIRDGVDQKYQDPVFIDAMNQKAKFLGLKSTHFANPQGFDNINNYSSASDLAILSNYAIKNYPLINSIVSKQYQFIESNSTHKQFDLYNWNGLLGVYPGAQGIKIGNTAQAGTTTVVLANRDGHKLLAVLLGAPGIIERDLWTSELLDLGFQKVANLKPVNITEAQLREKYSSWKYFN